MQEEQMNFPRSRRRCEGLKIASSIDELVDAYSGVECLVTNADGEQFYFTDNRLRKNLSIY